jgi:hypothetical protein
MLQIFHGEHVTAVFSTMLLFRCWFYSLAGLAIVGCGLMLGVGLLLLLMFCLFGCRSLVCLVGGRYRGCE